MDAMPLMIRSMLCDVMNLVGVVPYDADAYEQVWT